MGPAGPSTYHQGYEERDQFTGDIPLLRPSASSIGISEPQIQTPYDDEDDYAPDESTHIRYGRIPQRVPRRYKTVKKFE